MKTETDRRRTMLGPRVVPVVLHVIYFFSGVAALTLQVVWFKQLQFVPPVVGLLGPNPGRPARAGQ